MIPLHKTSRSTTLNYFPAESESQSLASTKTEGNVFAKCGKAPSRGTKQRLQPSSQQGYCLRTTQRNNPEAAYRRLEIMHQKDKIPETKAATQNNDEIIVNLEFLSFSKNANMISMMHGTA
jgi:hypothetical protein